MDTGIDRTEHKDKNKTINHQISRGLHYSLRRSSWLVPTALMVTNLEKKPSWSMLLTAQPARPRSALGCPTPPAPCPGGTDFWPAAPHSCWSTHKAESSGLRGLEGRKTETRVKNVLVCTLNLWKDTCHIGKTVYIALLDANQIFIRTALGRPSTL